VRHPLGMLCTTAGVVIGLSNRQATDTSICRHFEDGSDGTRTRDLRRDSSVGRWSRSAVRDQAKETQRVAPIDLGGGGQGKSVRSDMNLTYHSVSVVGPEPGHARRSWGGRSFPRALAFEPSCAGGGPASQNVSRVRTCARETQSCAARASRPPRIQVPPRKRNRG
jgi:hypothetical protein